LESLGDGMPVGRVGNGLAQRRPGAVQTVVELTPDPIFDIIALAARCCSHEGAQERLRIGFERGSRVLAELAGRCSALARYPTANPVDQHTARAGCFAKDFTFNNVVRHEV
jgi:hypothetical protein